MHSARVRTMLGQWLRSGSRAALSFIPLLLLLRSTTAVAAANSQAFLDEWRNLTSPAAPAPKVWVKGGSAVFFFENQTNGGFIGNWGRFRIPSNRYRVRSAVLRWDESLRALPQGERGWREATVIAGMEWRRLSTNLLEALTPKEPRHGAYYQAFLSDRILFRD